MENQELLRYSEKLQDDLWECLDYIKNLQYLIAFQTVVNISLILKVWGAW